jgi:phage terminase large subunit
MSAIVTKATKILLKLQNKIRAVSGGTGASKTYSIMMILTDYAQANRKQKIDVVSESFPHLEDGSIHDFKEIMSDRNYWNDKLWNESKHFYTFETGSVIKFISFDKLGKAHGPRRDVLFLNEGNYLPWNIVDQLITRTRKIVWIDWNPSEEFWFQLEMLGKRSDVDFLGEKGTLPPLTYLDNEALTQDEISEIESHKGNKNWWRVYGMGLLGELEHQIYKGWRVIDEVPFEARLERRWLDFGYTNDESAIGSVYYFSSGWILDEELYQKGMSNKQLADFLNSLPKKETTIVADSAEPKSIDEIRAYGLNVVPCQKGADSVRTGIQLVQDQPISVTRRSLNILKEQRNYMWMTDRDGRILNEEDPRCKNHHMSGIRYALSTLGRLKQEVSYWDRIYEDELTGRPKKKTFNKGQ